MYFFPHSHSLMATIVNSLMCTVPDFSMHLLESHQEAVNCKEEVTGESERFTRFSHICNEGNGQGLSLQSSSGLKGPLSSEGLRVPTIQVT